MHRRRTRHGDATVLRPRRDRAVRRHRPRLAHRRHPHRHVHGQGGARAAVRVHVDQFGARTAVGRLVSASMVKELGPVLTALMVTGRVGSGIAAELGSMMVTDQINVLRALGTDPVRQAGGAARARRAADGAGADHHRELRRPARRLVHHRLAASGGLERLLKLGGRRPLYADRLDGADQAVLPRFRDRHDRVSRRVANAGRDAGVIGATTNAVVAGSVAVLVVDFFVTKVLISVLY